MSIEWRCGLVCTKWLTTIKYSKYNCCCKSIHLFWDFEVLQKIQYTMSHRHKFKHYLD